mmetsp:Transcript_2971/g.4546  ORF Transcript_2971/g.4546 Transcript_2971/m.4546 type:complete len:478 (+) Transcript_2971:2-1435(+)
MISPSSSVVCNFTTTEIGLFNVDRSECEKSYSEVNVLERMLLRTKIREFSTSSICSYKTYFDRSKSINSDPLEETRKINLNLFAEEENSSTLLSFSPVAPSKKVYDNERFSLQEISADSTAVSNEASKAFSQSLAVNPESTASAIVTSNPTAIQESVGIQSSRPAVTVQTSVRESLLVVEKNSQVEKVELLGTVYATVLPSSNDGEGEGEGSVDVDIAVEDSQLLLKSLLLSKSVRRATPAQEPPSEQAQSVLVKGSPLQQVLGLSLARGQDRGAVPVLRYTCIDPFKPILLKARTHLQLQPPEEEPSYVDRTLRRIQLAVQIVLNPKFSFPLSAFTVQVSLAALQLKAAATGEVEGDVRIESVTAAGTGASLHSYNARSRVFTWNCGLVVPGASKGGEKMTLEAAVTVSLPLAAGSVGEGDLVVSSSLPMIIKGLYEGQLVSNRMISVSCQPSAAQSSSVLTSSLPPQSTIEFKFL